MKKIAVDAMGGDYAPQAIVEGVNQALADFSDIEIQLYGDESKIKQQLQNASALSIQMRRLTQTMSQQKPSVRRKMLAWYWRPRLSKMVMLMPCSLQEIPVLC